MKGNAKRRGISPRCIQNERKCDEEGGTPSSRIQNERKRDEEGLPPPRCIQNKRKHDEEGLPPPRCVQNKRKHDEEGENPSSSRLSFLLGRCGREGENGGAAQLAAAVGGSENIKKR